MVANTAEQTGRFSRETVKLMLDLNSLLRSHGIHIAITARDVERQLIQAAESCDDEEIQTLRQRLIEMQAQLVLTDRGLSSGVSTQLQGSYLDDTQETRSRAILVEYLSVNGLRFRTQSECGMARGDRLCVQFALDDKNRTLLWQEIQISKVREQTVWAEFIGNGNAGKVLGPFFSKYNT